MNQKVKLVEKRVRFSSLEQVIRLQLLLYCFTKDVHLTPGDYNLLTDIALNGYDRRLTPTRLVENGTFKHKQSIRNTRKKLLNEGFLVPSGKTFQLDPALEIETSGPLVIDFKALSA